MRVASTSTSPHPGKRRAPQQERATLRRAKFLEVAESLIGEVGYEATTMTAVAERANASIGTLYDYFPDKKTLSIAILAKYGEEVEAHWQPLLDKAPSLSPAVFADRFIDNMLEFVKERPAYLPLTGERLGFSRPAAARKSVRGAVARAFQATNPRLKADEALIIANVTVQQIKGLMALYKEATPKDRDLFTAEFKKILRLYLTEKLRTK
jgi:AcrR family transcriptional regulator